MEKIFVTKTSLPPIEEYIEKIKPLWESHWLTNMGTLHNELEQKLKKYLDVPYVSLMINGHFSLELAIQSMNFLPGSEVITSPFTFISTTHAIVRNSLKPVFCDIEPETCTIDPEKIEALITDKTVAIVATHVYGNMCDVDRIAEIATRYKLKVIYDAAHAFGVEYNEKQAANFGDLSIFSFHATKVFHTIEGGAVCCNTKEKYNQLYNLKNFGIQSEECIEAVGANAKMNEFQAAMGLCNLEYIDAWIKARKEIYLAYHKFLGNQQAIKLNKYKPKLSPNYAYMPVFFETEKVRNDVYDMLKEKDVYARKYFYPITSDAQCFEKKFQTADLDIARDMSKRVLTLPIYVGLEIQSVEYICKLILDFLKNK